jgi:AcrR family transcriptional regulator
MATRARGGVDEPGQIKNGWRADSGTPVSMGTGGFRRLDLTPISDAKTRLVKKAQEAFLTHGYKDLKMAAIANFCGVSRRTLYHHFSNKEELFRATLALNTIEAFQAAETAASHMLVGGGSAVDVIVAWLDVRFGDTRRRLGAAAHGREMNEVAFRIAMEWMIDVAIDGNHRIAALLEQLEIGGKLTLRPNMTLQKAARLLGDGARGVNQARPPIPNDLIAQHYYDIAEAILFGCAEGR